MVNLIKKHFVNRKIDTILDILNRNLNGTVSVNDTYYEVLFVIPKVTASHVKVGLRINRSNGRVFVNTLQCNVIDPADISRKYLEDEPIAFYDIPEFIVNCHTAAVRATNEYVQGAISTDAIRWLVENRFAKSSEEDQHKLITTAIEMYPVK